MSLKNAILLTIIFFISSFAPLILTDEADLLSAYGSYISGIATTIAIIWIVYNAHMQSDSIQKQQIEINLQREANQSSAKANNTDAFLRLLDQATKSMSMDARYVINTFCLENKDQRRLIVELDSSFFSGDSDAYFRCISSNNEISNWLKKVAETRSNIDVVSVCESMSNKHDKIVEQVRQLEDNQDIYDLLILSASFSHAAAQVKDAMKSNVQRLHN